MAKRTLVVVNPMSQGGAGRRRFERHEGRLRDALGEVEVEWTRGPRDAERIAREGVRAGVERVVVAGGDGTVSEVVTGLLAAGLGGYAELAVVPLGTGADLLRTLGIPRDPEAAIAAIRDGKPRRVDAGRVRYRRPEGGEATAYFLNTASLGIVGLITALVNEAPKQLGGRVSFIIGTVRGVLRYRQPTVRLRVDGELVHDGSLTFATAANGRYFGGGMYVAPDAEPDDGLLDFVLVSEFSRGKLLRHLPGFYRGTHVGVPGVRIQRGRVLEAEAPGARVWIDVDGEPLGVLPARFEIVPGAISFLGAGS
jgi:YegS/Rv2252/BmrU family lipid kinase